MEGAPPALRAEILAAVGRGPARCSSIARGLKELAEVMLTRAKAAAATRETAITLLAADALLTFALEATSESEPQRLADFG